MVYKIENIFELGEGTNIKEAWKGNYEIELLEVGQRAVFKRYGDEVKFPFLHIDSSKTKTLTTSIVQKVLYDGQDILVLTENTAYCLHCGYWQVKED